MITRVHTVVGNSVIEGQTSTIQSSVVQHCGDTPDINVTIVDPFYETLKDYSKQTNGCVPLCIL